jgi:hypothetical protein
MKRVAQRLRLAALIAAASVSRSIAGEPPSTAETTNDVDWRVVTVMTDDGRRLHWGTNTLAVGDFTNRLGEMAEPVDAVLIRRGGGRALSQLPPEMVEKLVRTGARIFVDADTGDEPADESTPPGGVQTLRIESSALRKLAALETGRRDAGQPNAREVSVSSALEVDTREGTYELREVGIGLWGDRLWFVRDLPRDDVSEDEGSVGIRFRHEW